MKRPTKEPTPETVKEAIAKLARNVDKFRDELRELKQQLGKFTEGRDLSGGADPPYEGKSPRTDEPKPALREVIWEYGPASNLEVPTRALVALAKDLDGAFRDIRAMRNDIAAIKDDSDLRADFKKWLPK